jgi:DNA-binding NarL/FixJ family response regulator
VKEKIRLLICEDHTLFREGLQAILREQAALEVVGEAADGRAAVEAARRLRPDVVLMDIEMPELSGFDATHRISRGKMGCRVLLLTLYDDEEIIARCLDSGAASYLLKDAPSSQLVYAIEAWTTPANRRRPARPRGQDGERTQVQAHEEAGHPPPGRSGEVRHPEGAGPCSGAARYPVAEPTRRGPRLLRHTARN